MTNRVTAVLERQWGSGYRALQQHQLSYGGSLRGASAPCGKKPHGVVDASMMHDSTANVLIGLKERSDDAFCRISVRYDLLMHDADPLVGIVLLEELAVVVHVLAVGLELALTVEDGLPTADSRH